MSLPAPRAVLRLLFSLGLPSSLRGWLRSPPPAEAAGDLMLSPRRRQPIRGACYSTIHARHTQRPDRPNSEGRKHAEPLISPPSSSHTHTKHDKTPHVTEIGSDAHQPHHSRPVTSPHAHQHCPFPGTRTPTRTGVRASERDGESAGPRYPQRGGQHNTATLRESNTFAHGRTDARTPLPPPPPPPSQPLSSAQSSSCPLLIHSSYFLFRFFPHSLRLSVYVCVCVCVSV